MDTNIFDENELYTLILAYFYDQYDNAVEQNENYHKLTDTQQSIFDIDIIKIIQDENVSDALKKLDEFAEDHSDYTDDELLEVRDELVSDALTAIINTDVANKYLADE